MAITISDTEPRIQYTATAGQTSFTVPFAFFANADLQVFNGTSQLTFNASPSNATQYSVTGAGVSGGGSITLGSPGATVNDVITIVREVAIERTTDFPTSGAFQIDSLNTELDKIIAMAQQLERDLKLSPRVNTTSSSSFNLTFPDMVAGKILSANAGGTGLEFSVDASGLLSAETNAATSATNAANSATASANSATAASNAQAAAEAALDTFDDDFLGSKTSDPSVDNDGNALSDGALYFNTTDNVMKVYDLGNTQWKQLVPTSSQQTNIDAAVANATNINAKFFDYDNKRLIESRGFLPSIGDKFYSPNTLETKSADPYEIERYQEGGMLSIMFTPFPSVRMFDGNGIGTEAKLRAAHQFKDKFEHIDPKIARMFLFSNSDLLPYSSTRKDSLLNVTKNREVTNYSLLTLRELTTRQHSDIKEAVKGTTQTISSFDDSYVSHNIVSVNDGKKINELRRFSLMRLTEIVVDCFYNQFDPENPPSDEILIPKTTFPHYHMFRMLSNQGSNSGNAIFLTDTLNQVMSVLSLNRNPVFFVNAGDLVCDSEGRYIGTIQSTFGASSAITIADINRRGNNDEKSGYKTTITLDEKFYYQ